MGGGPPKRWASVLLAWILSLQAAGFALQPVVWGAACCCARAEDHCRCPICTHARELEDPHSRAGSCGDPGSPAVNPAQRPFLARELPRATPAAIVPPAQHEPPALLDREPPEVPTPPPLA